MTPKEPLSFENATAVNVGGSYLTDPATGRVVRQEHASTDLSSIARGAQVAEGAPGPAAESQAAAVGVAPALPEASAASRPAPAKR